MAEPLFFILSTLLLAALLSWGFTFLPRERWQMIAVIPNRKRDGDSWTGINLTYYGFFIATSQMLSIMLMLILLGSLHISLKAALAATGLVLLLCLPASRILAAIIEKKKHTFTIGGASFVGFIAAPWSLVITSELFGYFGHKVALPPLPTLTAMAIGYTLGEGLGRLGCISFGCCYGKPLDQCSPLMQKIFKRMNFRFASPTRKAVYEGKLENRQLVPIQAITAIIYTSTALVCSALYLHSRFMTALLLATAVTQGWRFLSETVRADFRGLSKISAYQKMGLSVICYMAVVCLLLPPGITSKPALETGIALLWNPGLILTFQFMWMFFFLFFGRSQITSAEITFSLLHDRI